MSYLHRWSWRAGRTKDNPSDPLRAWAWGFLLATIVFDNGLRTRCYILSFGSWSLRITRPLP